MAYAPACTARVVKVDSSCGCTLSAAKWTGMSPDKFEALGTQEIDLARVIASSAEAEKLGVPERGLTALLKGSVQNIKGELTKQSISAQSVILPYIQRRQRSHINTEYFAIEAGAATTGAGSDGLPASAWDITVNLGPSPWATALQNLERYFTPGMTVYVMSWDNGADKTAQSLHFTVIAAENATDGGTQKAKITVKPNVSASAWDALSSGEKAAYQPTFGVAQVGANNISDREFWCNNQPSDLSMKTVPSYIQTTRESYCVTESYEEQLKLIMAGKINEFQKLEHLSIAEQMAQQKMHYEKAWLRSVFLNQRIDERQTPEYYVGGNVADDYLVTDPNQTLYGDGCVHEYKANALGIHTLLNDCNRVVDFAGATLNLETIFEEVYKLKRNREANGKRVDAIDIMTDRWTADRIRQVMSRYIKAKYAVETTRYADMGKTITFDGQIMFNYDKYDLPDAGIPIMVYHDQFFDDLIYATPDDTGTTPAGFKSRARYLWMLDWSDIKVGIAGTSQVTRKHPDANTAALYRCIIEANQNTYNLRGTRWTVLLDRPETHVIYQNFSGECPTVSGTACEPTAGS